MKIAEIALNYSVSDDLLFDKRNGTLKTAYITSNEYINNLFDKLDTSDPLFDNVNVSIPIEELTKLLQGSIDTDSKLSIYNFEKWYKVEVITCSEKFWTTSSRAAFDKEYITYVNRLELSVLPSSEECFNDDPITVFAELLIYVDD